MKLERRYTTSGQDPLDQISYEERTTVIANPDGSEVFRMEDLEVPASWSQLATDIVASKYFRKRGVAKTLQEMRRAGSDTNLERSGGSRALGRGDFPPSAEPESGRGGGAGRETGQGEGRDIAEKATEEK